MIDPPPMMCFCGGCARWWIISAGLCIYMVLTLRRVLRARCTLCVVSLCTPWLRTSAPQHNSGRPPIRPSDLASTLGGD